MDLESTIAAVIILLAGLVGIGVNAAAILVVIQRRLHKNPFGLLCLGHEIPDVIILVTFAFFCAPITLFQITTVSSTEIGKILGHIDFVAWNITVYSHVCVAINRLTAIYFPVWYRQFFKLRTTVIIECCYIVVAVLQSLPLITEDCYIAYLPQVYLWIFSPTPCGTVLQNTDMSLGISLMTVVMIIDFCTFWKIKMTVKSIEVSQPNGDHKNQRQEIRFFMQVALIQATVYIVKKLCFYVFSRLATGKWALFFLTFFAWIMCHLMDGVILIVYNYKRGPKRTVKVSTTLQLSRTQLNVHRRSMHK
uniref:G_PROTEIN_RECEP_F1_2 domain-containing protein n=1 Tax=Steinernema glaseri TaxID=37863 RepID=A0A1I7ZSB5_9BILA